MKTYTIGIEEIVSCVFTVEAEEAESALEIVKEKNKNGEIVVAENCTARNIAVLEPENVQTCWDEF